MGYPFAWIIMARVSYEESKLLRAAGKFEADNCRHELYEVETSGVRLCISCRTSMTI